MSLGKDYIFKSQTKKQLLILFASGILLTVVGVFMIINGDGHHEEVSTIASESSHYEFHWYQRLSLFYFLSLSFLLLQQLIQLHLIFDLLFF